jgi:SPP1 gp7 family putative phage head morphogenesis protein
MCEVCQHITTYAEANKMDPTKTSVLRQNFVKNMNRRFAALKKAIYKTVVTNDAFGLNDQIQANIGAPKNSFAFSTNPEKVDAFMRWLNGQINQELLQTEYRMQLGQAGMKPWTNMYITDSYKRGIERANYEAREAGIKGVKSIASQGGIDVVMGLPIHADRLGMLYSRTFAELKGITGAMDSQISKVLAQGIADGDGPRTIASKLTKTIGGGLDLVTKTKSGITRMIPAQVRAQTLARTEIIRAHHVATIQEYKNWGLAGVKVQAEWSTAGDDRVCEQCASLEGKVYTLEEIEPMIPVHPNCRCIALPQLDESKSKEVEKVTTVENPITVSKPFNVQTATQEEMQNFAENILSQNMPNKNIEFSYVGFSDTNGKSMYYKAFPKGQPDKGVKLRFSDHAISNEVRVTNEVQFGWKESDYTFAQNKIGFLLDLPGYDYKQIDTIVQMQVPQNRIAGRKVIGEIMPEANPNSRIAPSMQYIVEVPLKIWQYVKT